MTTAIPAATPSDLPLVSVSRRGGNAARLLRRPSALFAVVVLLVLLLLVIFAPLITPLDPQQVDTANTLQPPGQGHPMGTDNLGRDVWTRFLYGGRISLVTGFAACALGALIGVSLGLVAGYYGRRLDSVLLWLSEVLLAFPGILLAMVILAVLGAGQQNVILAVGVALIPSFLRMARASVLAARHEPYVDAARALGARNGVILLRHILPNIVRPLLVLLTLGVGGAILEGAALSFLGLGAQPPSPEWGAMLNGAQGFMRVAWWMSFFPGMGIFLTVLAINLLGDAYGDVAAHR